METANATCGWLPEIRSMRGNAIDLLGAYPVWILVIAIAYPLCKWYERYKAAHKDKWWLGYGEMGTLVSFQTKKARFADHNNSYH